MADCPPRLPSMQSATALTHGDMKALPDVMGHLLGRAALMSIGLAFTGERGKDLVKKSLAGAVAIEVFVLMYAARQKVGK